MEFDNDRLRKHTNKIEIAYWMLLAVMSPLINSATIFIKDFKIWPVLLLINFCVLPAYFFYGRIAGPLLFKNRRWVFFTLISILSFLVIQTFTFTLYLLVLKFVTEPLARDFFTYYYPTAVRESLWIIVNMFLATAIYFIGKAIEEKDHLITAKKDNTFFKLRYLRAQLNPHFLFNTLNSIYSLSLQKSDKTPEVVVKLADLMRYLIYECNEEQVPLNKEIDFIKNYIDIERVRYRADIKFIVEGDTNDFYIEPFLFISFIENAFKHALDHSFAEPFIYITLKVGREEIMLNVINSCDADLGEQAKRINGKGISNSKRLLELLYPDSYALDIIQTDKQELRSNNLRLKHAKDRLETLYPDAYTLDTILNKNTFTVSLIIKLKAA